ncbi:MAG: SRPBCC family protein [Rubripirellula sp.]
MGQISVTKVIQAPPAIVFQAIADVPNLSNAVPYIKEIEILSDTQSGVGTRFRETRVMHGKEYITVLEVTEYSQDDHVRMVADEGGTVWDSLFQLIPRGDGTRLEMTMESRPYKWTSKIVTPLIQSIVQRGVEVNMDCVKKYCEELCSPEADDEESDS